MRIAVDAMGGDFAPQNVVEGAVQALREQPNITELLLVGDEKRVEAELRKHGARDPRLQLIHASEIITMNDAPVQALRRKRDASMPRAIDLVKQRRADAVVSAGNTGAFMAASHLKLRTLEGVSRPGLAVAIPAPHNVFVLIDAGANLEPHPSHLVQYGVMGGLYAREILGVKNPRIGLFSIGSEDLKGNELTLEAFELFKQSGLNFVGNVDGHDLFANIADVIVADAFVGNAILKSCESAARAISHWLKEELKKNPVRMLGAMIAGGAFRSLRRKLDPDEYGGAIFLGINGICIKAHGSSSPKAIRNALRVACEFVVCHVNDHIVEEVKQLHDKIQTNIPQPKIEIAT
jgi:glycerol-3-phosphate acyltransferase PlsX